MIIDLDDAQQAVLCELIARRLSNLSSEIRHTDNRELRQGLRDERELLQSLVAVLSPPSGLAS
jgi:hypothetical protein